MTLVRANILFVAVNLLHTADHQRQGTAGLTTEIMLGGSAITLAAIVSLVMALRRDKQAPTFGALRRADLAPAPREAPAPPGRWARVVARGCTPREPHRAALERVQRLVSA